MNRIGYPERSQGPDEAPFAVNSEYFSQRYILHIVAIILGVGNNL